MRLNHFIRSQLMALRHGKQQVSLGILCLVLVQCSFTSLAYGQGLLGKPFLQADFSMSSPNDPVVKEVYDWIYGAGLSGNLPVNDTVDINISFGMSWADGEVDTSGGPVNFEQDVKGVTATVVKHFFPDQTWDPFIAAGVGYRTIDFEASAGTTTFSQEDDSDSALFWTTGFEWKIGDQVAIRPQMGSGSSFDNFEAGDLFDELFFETQLICWLTEEFYTGFSIGSDFDDTEISLGFFIGVGQW